MKTRKLMQMIGIWIILLPVALIFTGCNLFSFLHQEGSSTDTDTLINDGYTALSRGEYDKASEYFEDAITSDPESSEAYVGKATAQIRDILGVDFITTLLDAALSAGGESSTSSVSSLTAGTTEDNFLQKLEEKIADMNELFRTMLDVSSYLTHALGWEDPEMTIPIPTDGSVDPEDPDLNLNLALANIIIAAGYYADAAHQSALDIGLTTIANDIPGELDNSDVLDPRFFNLDEIIYNDWSYSGSDLAEIYARAAGKALRNAFAVIAEDLQDDLDTILYDFGL